MASPLYQKNNYTIHRADNRLVIHHDGHPLPDAPCTLAEAISLVDDYARCEWCGGEGVVTCDMCKGERVLVFHEDTDYMRMESCPGCLGRGWVRCPRCGGK